MAFQSFNSLLICDEPIQNARVGNATVGYRFALRYPSYRGTFLSCITGFDVYVDGEKMPDNMLCFEVNGKQFLVEELRELHREYWFVLDKAHVFVRAQGGAGMGKTHTVRVAMSHRIPYTGYFGQYLVLDTDERRELAVV